jgi:hypothetical protein
MDDQLEAAGEARTHRRNVSAAACGSTGATASAGAA